MTGKWKSTVESRFWAKVDKRGPDECWEWQGARQGQLGYGSFWNGVTNITGHRMALRLAGVPIDGRLVCHRCNNPPCVNPSHLYVGTRADNARDAVAIGKIIGPRPNQQGIRHNLAKLDDVKILEIRQTRGVSQRGLAKRYGVHQSTINNILLGKTWTHVHSVSP